MRWVVAVVPVVLGGCFSKPEFYLGDGGVVVDTPTACSAFGAWSSPEPLGVNQIGKEESAAALSGDGTRLVFVADHLTSSNDLYISRWNGSDFVTETRIDAISDGSDQNAPAWSADETKLYWRNDGFEILASDVTAGPVFGAPEPSGLMGLPSDLIRPRFLPDGNTVVYYGDFGATGEDLYYATRTGGSGWTVVPSIMATINAEAGDQRAPALSEDGLTLYFSLNDTYLRTSERSSSAVPFGPSQPFDPGGITSTHLEPELSRDGTKFVFTRIPGGSTFGDLFLMTRACVP